MTIKPGNRHTDRSASPVTVPPDASLQEIEPSSCTLRRVGKVSDERVDDPREPIAHKAAADTNNAPASSHRTPSVPCMTKLGPTSSEAPDSSKPSAGIALVISIKAAARAERPTSIRKATLIVLPCTQTRRLITSVPLVPPNPKELEMAVSMRIGRASLAQ